MDLLFPKRVCHGGSEHAKRARVEGRQSSKYKKSKRKREDGEPAAEVSAGDPIVTSKDKKRKKEHKVVLEEGSQMGSQIDITKMGEKREGKKKRRKESDKVGSDLSQNGMAGGEEADVDRKNDKKKKKSKEMIGDRKREKEKEARLKDSQIDITKMGEKREGKKKRRKESNKVGSDLSQNGMPGGEEADVDRKNDKKKKKSKEMIGDRKREKEKEARLKDSQIDITKMGEKREGKKKRRKESDKVGSDLSQNGMAGGEEADVDRKNDKKKKKSNEMIGDRKRHKEKEAQLKDSQIDITKMGDNREGKKKRRKESDKVGSDLSQNGMAGGEEADVDRKNDKKKKKSKEMIGDRKREKEKEARLKDRCRRVSFADDVEVFSLDGGDDEDGGRSGESKLVHGQRFTLEEDATLMEAIMNYAEMKQLGEKGLEMIRESRKHPELKGCWADIAKSLPHRPSLAIYKRARILLYRSDERKWTLEEYEKIRRFVEKNGTDWKTLARELGKSEIHVKDTWRRIKPKNLKTGHWTQDEYQNLFDLVNLDLRVKAHQEYDHGHRVIRENISWEAISDKLTTRNHKNCCIKWYNQLASPLVKQGIWSDADDYRLLEALQKDDAVCVEDVDWESLLDHRSGEVCRQRWNQMVRNIGGHREKPFVEQVEVLSKRYCIEMLDYRK